MTKEEAHEIISVEREEVLKKWGRVGAQSQWRSNQDSYDDGHGSFDRLLQAYDLALEALADDA